MGKLQKEEIKLMIKQAQILAEAMPARRSTLRSISIRRLYLPRCGAVHIGDISQNYTHVTVHACEGLIQKVMQFLEGYAEIKEEHKDDYPYLWEMKQPSQDEALDNLSQMPASPQELMLALKSTQGKTGTPFGRLPTVEQVNQIPIVFVRMLLCLELGNVRYADGPCDHEYVRLIEKVVQGRASQFY